jgi:hypothetical protein
MTATALDGKKSQTLAEIFLWWTILAIFAAAVLLLPASRAGAQTSGPLPATAPSDQPVASSRAAAPAQIGGKPKISGTWALNKDESDDPRAAMQQGGNSGGEGNSGGGRYGAGGGGNGGGGGWGGGGGQHGGSGGSGGGGGRHGGQNGSGGAMNNFSQLTIEQTASSAKVTGDSGNVLALYSASEPAPANPSAGSSTNSSNTSSGDSDTVSAPPAAQWQGSQLVAVTPGRRQGSTTRTYELSPDGKQLYVTTKIDNPRFTKPVTFRLVYDPAPSGG